MSAGRSSRERKRAYGTFSTRFTELVGVPPSTYRTEASNSTVGIPSCVAKQFTRPIRNREAAAPARP